MKMEAWAICDTDGGRREVIPLLRRIFATREAAEGNRRHWLPEDVHRYYPINRITITMEECPWHEGRKSRAA